MKLTLLEEIYTQQHAIIFYAPSRSCCRTRKSRLRCTRRGAGRRGKWSILDKKNPTKRKEALESLALKFWPLLHINALPDSDDANAGDSNARVSRVQVIDRYTAEHPVEALSKHPSDWLHAPFNVKELAHNFSDAAEFYL